MRAKPRSRRASAAVAQPLRKIPISRPYFGSEEREAILGPLASGWVVQGPKVAEFEGRFAAFTGSPHAIATTSCTTALHLALVALGVGPGDDVIVPAFTWVATANVVEALGARPVFVDIDLDTFNVSLDRLEHALTPRTKVVMPVSLFGLSAPMEDIVALARRRGLWVVEDDACATGARYGGRHAGTLADLACFSFHPRKAITTGEGGMILTADDQRARQLRSLRDHGASVSDLARHQGPRSYLLPEFDVIGYNYRMTDLQGALGVAQLGRLEAILERRRAIAARYDAALPRLPWLRPPTVSVDCVHGYQSYVCLFAPEPPSLESVERLHGARNELMDALDGDGVATRPGTHAVHTLGVYRRKYGLAAQDFPNAYLADRLTVALPLFAQLTHEEQDYVVARLAEHRPKGY